MKATERYGFPYPENEDFADGSTQLAFLANTINDELQARIDAFNDVLTPPTYIWGKSAGSNYTNSANYQLITWDTEIYKSDTLNSGTIGNLFVPTPGIYQAGMFAVGQLVGAATANSARNFKLEYIDRRGASFSDQVTLVWTKSTLEAATTVACTMHVVFPVYTPDYLVGGLRGYVQHANVASQLQVTSVSFIWISRLGDLVV